MIDFDTGVLCQCQVFSGLAVMQAFASGVFRKGLSLLRKKLGWMEFSQGHDVQRQTFQTGLEFLDFALVRGCKK